MDAETRHQLKQNEFAEFLSKAKDFRDPRLWTWGIVIVAIAGVYFGYRAWSWRSAVANEQHWNAIVSVNTRDLASGDAALDELRRVIHAASDPAIQAAARLRLAAALEERAVARLDDKLLDQAASELQSAANGVDIPVTLRAAAIFKLATIQESRRQFDAARGLYQQLGEGGPFDGSPFVPLAAERLESLDDLRVDIRFSNEAPPLTLPEPPESAAPLEAPAKPSPNLSSATQPALTTTPPPPAPPAESGAQPPASQPSATDSEPATQPSAAPPDAAAGESDAPPGEPGAPPPSEPDAP